MYAPSFRRLVSLTAMAGLAVFPGLAPAQYVWTSATSSNWNNAANWTGGIPVSAATTTLTFGAGTYTATNDLAAAPFQLTGLTFGSSGTATISDSAAQGLDFVGATPTITMGAGNGTVTSAITLGANTNIGGGAGTLTLSGAINDAGGNFALNKASSGSLVLSGGGSYLQLSLQAGSTTISGGTLALTMPDPFMGTSRLAGLQLGSATGQTASVVVNGGATVNVTENIFIGDIAGSTGTMTVSGAGTTVNNTIGGASGRLAVGNFGNGTLNILNGGQVTCSNLFTPREPGTNTGTILVDGPGSALHVTTEASFSSNGTGTATFSHGATFDGGADILLGVNATGNGVLTFTDPGTTATAVALLVAYAPMSTNCTINILNGAKFDVTPGGGSSGAYIGNGGASSGTVNVSGPGSTLSVPGVTGNANVNGLTIGQAGTGVLNISNGGSAQAGVIFVGDAVGASGTVNVTGYGSSFIVGGTALIGGDFDSTTGAPIAGGTAVINAGAGTTVSLGVTNLYGGGTLNVNTGYLGSFTVAGLNDGIPGSSVGTVAVGGIESTITIKTNGNNASFSGIISGAGGLTKTGTGTQTLTGTSTFTGPVEIDGGVLNFTALANLGAGTVITFNGGTLQYAAGNTSDISARKVVINGSGATIDIGNNNVTFANTIGSSNPQNDPLLFYPPVPGFGTGALTKLGAGTLTLAPAPLTTLPAGTPGFNNYIGGTNIIGGTLAVASDLALGAVNMGTTTAPVLVPKGDVTGAAAGTLLFTGTTSTSRNYAMNGGTVAVAASQTVTFNGSVVSGATLNGNGTFTTDSTNGAQFISAAASPAVAIISNSPNDQFVHFSSSDRLNVAPNVNPTGTSTTLNFSGFINQGSGSITVGAGSRINVADFQSYGSMNLAPATVSGQVTEVINQGGSSMFFNGGSRTFVGTPGTTGPPFVAGMDLHGHDIVIAGGLFVNNGFLADSTASPGKVIVDYGALFKGAGTQFVSVVTQNGGRVQAGNSPGSMGFGQFVFGPGGVNNYVFAIDDATGNAGPKPDAAGLVSGWGLVKAVKQSFLGAVSSGNFIWSADPTNKVTVAIDTLVNPTTVGTDVPGMMDHFNPNLPYSWQAAHWDGKYKGPEDVGFLNASTSFDTSTFLNPVAGTFGWSLDEGNHTLSLVYNPTAVPEPGTLALLGVTAAAAGLWRRRRNNAMAGGA